MVDSTHPSFVTVQCPQCRKLMKTAPKVFVKAVKRCVYCGKSFKIHTPGGETRIIVSVPVCEGFSRSSERF